MHLICSQVIRNEEHLEKKLVLSFEPPRRNRRKHIFGEGSKDVQLSYEDDFRRTIFSSIDRLTAKIRGRLQQLQNLAQKYVLMSEVILSMDQLNLDQAPQDINKEFQLLSEYVYKLSLLQQTQAVKKNSLGPAVWVY
ncbi:uncharacterized protein TNCV_379421 [Trichonephila clavipes]|nr:uncharacterized protein TNCV_379421 [Trichonephila clavipes]